MFTKALISEKTPQKEAEKIFARSGFAVLAIEEDSNGCSFWLQGKVDCSSYSFVIGTEWVSSEVDWEEQWRTFSPCFKEGLFHLDLAPWGVPHTLLLKPGPGFGDLSHPTTRLMIEMMKKEVRRLKRRQVVDIGSGSGVLTLAASLIGTPLATGIDIDVEANRHARKNAKMNNLKVQFFAPGKKALSYLESAGLILINMIFEEQKQALGDHQAIQEGAYLISSGILAEQKSSYIRWMQERWFYPLEVFQEGEWLGLIFHKKRPSRKDSIPH